MKPREPKPVKLIVGVITGVPSLIEPAARALEERYGPVERRSAEFPFDFTAYYEDEMGGELRRVFLSFRDLIDPGELAAIKLHANAVEGEMAARGGGAPSRPINLDPGYIAASKLVLATTKDYSHRIYIGCGIYAEVTLVYREGGFQPMPWTYPDYRTEGYGNFFAEVRAAYLAQLSGSQRIS